MSKRELCMNGNLKSAENVAETMQYQIIIAVHTSDAEGNVEGHGRRDELKN